MKLKTLKDLEAGKYEFKGLVRLDHLRQEAIKDIKYFQSMLDSIPEFNKQYTFRNNKGKALSKEAIEGIYKGKIQYIKWKFNITKEDLKWILQKKK